jgi:hypothetical protein
MASVGVVVCVSVRLIGRSETLFVFVKKMLSDTDVSVLNWSKRLDQHYCFPDEASPEREYCAETASEASLGLPFNRAPPASHSAQD